MASRAVKQKFIENFRNVTQASPAVSATYWKTSNGDIEAAIDSYFSEHNLQSAPEVAMSDALFALYADKIETDKIKPDGLQRLCNDIGIEPVDPEILVFAYHCEAQEMGVFTKESFLKGLLSLDISNPSIENLKNKVSEMRETLKVPQSCKPVYQFLFNFAKDPSKKHIPLDECLAYWDLILKPHFPLYHRWDEFCRTSSSIKQIVNKDLWNTLWDFATTVSPDLTDYDFDDAWPITIDEFVNWCSANK